MRSIQEYWKILLLTFLLIAFQASLTATIADSTSLEITSYDDPEFVETIHNVTVPLGREAVLSCVVNNLGKYKVGWLKVEDQTILTLHNKVVTHNSRVSVTHDTHKTWNLHIRQVKENDRGCYMCQINTSIMKKQYGCIDVHVPPNIVDEETSSDLTVQEGDNATLVCRATGHPTPRILWRREDGEKIVLRKGYRDVFKVDNFSGEMLHFIKLDRKQMGAFLCIASNDVPPAVSKRITLAVNFAPVIKVPNQLLGAPLGTNVHLECHVEAFPNTINYWVKNRGEMLLDGRKYTLEEEKVSYKVFMRLTIRSFNQKDIGVYTCVSTNSLGRSEGTIRLYEIKIPTGGPVGSTENQVVTLSGYDNTPNTKGTHHKDPLWTTYVSPRNSGSKDDTLPPNHSSTINDLPAEDVADSVSNANSWKPLKLVCVLISNMLCWLLLSSFPR